MFAIYRDRETGTRYFNGAGYVIRHDMYPHTHFGTGRPVTLQGHAMLVGIRQGTSGESGFAYRRYSLPDSEPLYVPPGYAGRPEVLR